MLSFLRAIFFFSFVILGVLAETLSEALALARIVNTDDSGKCE